MRPATLTTTVALIGAVMLGSAAARPGDERVIEGTLVWPETLTEATTAGGERRVVVHDDAGVRYLAHVTASTEIPESLHAGQRVVLRGREGFAPAHLVAARVSSPATDAAVQAPGGAQVEGTVIAVSGTMLLVQDRHERQVAVDISAIGLPVRELLQPGREVRLFGTLRDGARLIASGLEFTYTPSALPRPQAR